MNHQSRIASRSTITSKGQTTVPKQVRDELGLYEGTQLDWIVKDGQAIVKPRTLRAADLAGFLGKSPVGHVSIEDMDEAAASAAVARFERSKR
jgi:AbrB family looped-hinge helix DNA binding protein